MRKIDLIGNGQSAEDENKKNNGQKWVMLNINQGSAWDAETWNTRFGKPSIVPVDGLNPKVIKAYYYPTIDMTIFVNSLNSTISHYRLQKVGK